MSKPEGYQVTSTTENISIPAEEALQLQHEDFIRLCNGKKNKSPTAYESLEVAKVINLIKKNLYANKKSNK